MAFGILVALEAFEHVVALGVAGLAGQARGVMRAAPLRQMNMTNASGST
jgi:hypothetical protein